MTNDEIITALVDAAKGLLYPSESDEPFATFRWAKVGNETAQQAVVRVNGKLEGVSTTSLNDFFKELEGSDDGERFAALHAKIGTLAPATSAVRAGKITVDVILIGEHDGEWLGLKTRSIET
jgi:hypothetical protein